MNSFGPSEIVVHGSIAEAALRERRESELIVWLCGNGLKTSPGGNGISRRRLVRFLVDIGLFSKSYVRQLLKQGNGIFWHLGARSVFLIGACAVAERLGVSTRRGDRQVISLKDLHGGRAKRRGVILGAALRNDLPISQAAICRLAGVSDRSQRRYRANGCFLTKRQDADLTAIFGPASRGFLACWANGNARKGVYMGGAEVRRRLPNLHKAIGERIPAGARSKHIFRGLQPLEDGKGCQSLRVWFASHSDWWRCATAKLGTEAGERYVDSESGLNCAYLYAGDGIWEAAAMLTGR